jgi:uncharacterized protein (DUF1330 family)
MAAYLISICKSVTDRRRLEDYWANVAPSFEGYGAKPFAAYTPFEVLEGGTGVKGIVLFEFPSVEIAKRWYTSSAYQDVKRRRRIRTDPRRWRMEACSRAHAGNQGLIKEAERPSWSLCSCLRPYHRLSRH